MLKRTLFITTLLLFLGSTSFASKNPAQEEIQSAVDRFEIGCSADLATYCGHVVPGDNRLLSCLYSVSDKISSQCEFALYDSLNVLDQTLATLAYTANQCRADIEKSCATIEPNEGRIFECLEKNKTTISEQCKAALHSAGWDK